MLTRSLKNFVQLTGIIIFLGIIAACSPTGNFGRVATSPKSVFDTFPNKIDLQNYSLEQTDEEINMQNLMQRFVSTNQGQSWLSKIRLSARALSGAIPDQSDYYLWLRAQRYASTTGRYRTLLNEVKLDILTLPNVFGAICAVQATDERRSIAAKSLPQTSQQTLQAVVSREQNNNQIIENFVQKIQFRYDSYSYALENLLVESPDEIARIVDSELNILAAKVQFAGAGQFCSK